MRDRFLVVNIKAAKRLLDKYLVGESPNVKLLINEIANDDLTVTKYLKADLQLPKEPLKVSDLKETEDGCYTFKAYVTQEQESKGTTAGTVKHIHRVMSILSLFDDPVEYFLEQRILDGGLISVGYHHQYLGTMVEKLTFHFSEFHLFKDTMEQFAPKEQVTKDETYMDDVYESHNGDEFDWYVDCALENSKFDDLVKMYDAMKAKLVPIEFIFNINKRADLNTETKRREFALRFSREVTRVELCNYGIRSITAGHEPHQPKVTFTGSVMKITCLVLDPEEFKGVTNA